MLAGFMILLYHPDRVGDSITVTNDAGPVVDINLRYIHFKTQKKLIVVPNARYCSIGSNKPPIWKMTQLSAWF